MMLAILTLSFFVTITVHELGHAVAAWSLELPWRFVLTWHGPGVEIGDRWLTPTKAEIRLTAAGGPLANLALLAFALDTHVWVLAALSADFLIFNLIPFKRSDGRKIIRGTA